MELRSWFVTCESTRVWKAPTKSCAPPSRARAQEWADLADTSAPPADDSVTTSVSNGVGRIELNRPKLINALSQDMVGAIDDALSAWRDDDSVSLVLVTGRGER